MTPAERVPPPGTPDPVPVQPFLDRLAELLAQFGDYAPLGKAYREAIALYQHWADHPCDGDPVGTVRYRVETFRRDRESSLRSLAVLLGGLGHAASAIERGYRPLGEP